MFDTIQYVAQDLLQPDAFPLFLLRILGWLIAGVTVAILLTCFGFALAQCCGGGRKVRRPLGLMMLVALAVGGVGRAAAQDEGNPDSIPEIELRFERLWGADSIRLATNLGGPQSGDRITVSPDGQWILLEVLGEAEHTNLWLAPTHGGEMVRLTEGKYRDGDAQWLPSGDGVAFTSSRTSEGTQTFQPLMRVPIAPHTGTPLGPPRQVTLDGVYGWEISPDGRQVAYAAGVPGAATSLRVLPATGGTARTIIDLSGAILYLRWGAEGRYLYFLSWGNFSVSKVALMRVPVQGGEPQTVSVWDSWIHLSPHAEYLYRPLGEGRFELATVEGQPLARFHLPEDFTLAGFADSPGELFAVRQDIVNPLRVVPVAGGPIQQLNEDWGYDVPLGWSADGKEVFFSTELNGERIFMFAPLDGGPLRQVPLSENHMQGAWARISTDGRHVLYLSKGKTEGEIGVWIHDLAQETSRKVDEGVVPPGVNNGRWAIRGRSEALSGGATQFLYGLTRNGAHELMAARADGSTQLLWRFPQIGDEEPPTVAVHSGRIAFTKNDGQTGSLFLARVGEDREQLLLTLPGGLSTRGSNPPSWSPDGRLLALSYRAPESDGADVLLVQVSESGEVIGEPLILPMEGGPNWWWGLEWMPDGEHFLVNGEGAEGLLGTEVWLVSLDPEAPPVVVTSDIQEMVWGFELSPDGGYIAIESEIPRGSSVWRVSLGDVLGASGG